MSAKKVQYLPRCHFWHAIGTGRDRLAAGRTNDVGLAPQPRGRPRHAIAAARANEFDLGGIFQRMVGQSSSSAKLAYHGRISTASLLAIGMTLGKDLRPGK
jgi:hypothetical protein